VSVPNAILTRLVSLLGDDDKMFNSEFLLEILKIFDESSPPLDELSLLSPIDVKPPFCD
jgi:hypothetical protein